LAQATFAAQAVVLQLGFLVSASFSLGRGNVSRLCIWHEDSQ